MNVDSCPQCSEPLPSPRPSLCPRCYFALPPSTADSFEQGVTNEPEWTPYGSSSEDRTRPVPVSSPHRAASPHLGDQPVRPVPPPPVTTPRPSRTAAPTGLRPWMIAVPATAVVVLAVVVAVAFLRPQGPAVTPGGESQSATSSPTANRSQDLTRIDSATIQVAASSVLPPNPPVNYKAENTLDGDLTKAWNSDGVRSAGTRVTLTYTFANSVRVGRIELANGYQQDANTYARNRRIKTLTVTTDEAERTFDVTDTTGYQPLDFDFGSTRKVVLRIVDTYPGTRHNDIAISEVAFHRIG